MDSKKIDEALHAHTNLNLFGAIVTLLEGGHLYGGNNAAAKRIRAICLKEQQRQLRILDKATARAA